VVDFVWRGRDVLEVEPDEVARESPVALHVGFVEDKVDEIEARQERRRELNVLHHAEARVVPREAS